MKKFFAKENITAIKVSLIACVIFAVLIEPIMEIGRNLGKGLIVALVDYFYYSCGRVDNVYFISYLLFLVFLMYMIKNLNDIVKLYRNIFVCNEKSSDAEDAATTEQHSLDVKMEAVIKIEKEKRKLKRQKRAIKILAWFAILCQIMVLCYITVYMYMPAVKNRLFERAIVQITPYTEREKIELLQSKWVSMETEADYSLIVNEINHIQEENSLK